LIPLVTLIGLLTMPAPAAAEPIPPPSFPPLRHGIKAVFGPGGGDYDGALEGQGRRLTEAFHDLHVSLTRIAFTWADIESHRGAYDWSKPDRLIDFLTANHIEPALLMYCAPIWARRGSPRDREFLATRHQENLYDGVFPRREFRSDFERFCETASRRYAGKVRLYEFWNEPDGMGAPIILHDAAGKGVEIRFGGDATEYTWWLKPAYAAIKRGNPKAVVAAGSLCIHTTNFIEALYAAGGRSACDAVSLHPYGGDGINRTWIEQVRWVMARNGDWAKPIWLTEFGWVAEGTYQPGGLTEPASPERQARLVADCYPVIWSLPYVTHAFLFTLNDWSAASNDQPGLNAFGLLDLHLRRRPSFEAYRQAVAATPREPRQTEFHAAAVLAPPGPIDFALDGSAILPLVYNNPVGRSQNVGIIVEAPDVLAAPVHDLLKVGAGRTRSDLVLHARPGAPPGSWPLLIGSTGMTPICAEITVPAPARRAARPPAIDAQLDEWADALAIRQERMVAGFQWDDERLYFACRVIDDNHEQPYQDANLWKGDCIQLAFDAARDAVRMAGYDDNDTELALALTPRGPMLWRYACPPDKYVGALPREYLAARRTGNETFYEAAIPWRDLGIQSPVSGQLIGTCISACDWTAGKGVLYRFGDGIIGGKVPSRFASIRLK
jgi:hypothetical protein